MIEWLTEKKLVDFIDVYDPLKKDKSGKCLMFKLSKTYPNMVVLSKAKLSVLIDLVLLEFDCM